MVLAATGCAASAASNAALRFMIALTVGFELTNSCRFSFIAAIASGAASK
jgi:hypothetical protein